MLWRLISDRPCNAFYNIALDEAVCEAVRKKLSPPTLRLYQWAEPSVSIGYFQKISDINIDYCKKKNYRIVRRATGGTALLHDSELTYSFSAAAEIRPFNRGFLENYMLISRALVSALKLIGLNAQIALTKNSRQRNPFCFKTSTYGEITVNGHKVIGSAQKRYKNGFLQQGSIPINFSTEELGKVLRNYNPPSPPSTGQAGGVGLSGEIGTISKYAPAVSVEDLKMALKEAFETIFNIRLISDRPTGFELNLAETLTTEKYSTKEWNFSR